MTIAEKKYTKLYQVKGKSGNYFVLKKINVLSFENDKGKNNLCKRAINKVKNSYSRYHIESEYQICPLISHENIIQCVKAFELTSTKLCIGMIISHISL